SRRPSSLAFLSPATWAPALVRSSAFPAPFDPRTYYCHFWQIDNKNGPRRSLCLHMSGCCPAATPPCPCAYPPREECFYSWCEPYGHSWQAVNTERHPPWNPAGSSCSKGAGFADRLKAERKFRADCTTDF